MMGVCGVLICRDPSINELAQRDASTIKVPGHLGKFWYSAANACHKRLEMLDSFAFL